ncbi:MAG: tRNA (adenosine(37)-N6)-threonylcarbamoyltransferase complex ATPase subunit type 1 TsaE [Parvibaculum sp.]|nr:tRNA (adenosine(37)-N6)-threonylcarbamoyltransferase complex ATPase subunit type 1 TsaE [Parvibaculum sp.]
MKSEPPKSFSRDLTLPDEAATEALGRALASLLRVGDFVALNGDLGAGKTALARAIIRARLGDDDEDVPSPTFTLVQTYEAPEADGAEALLITHVDLYRLDDPSEVRELGLGEALDEGAILMEWSEKLGSLPATRLDITLTLKGDQGARACRLTAHGAFANRLEALNL